MATSIVKKNTQRVEQDLTTVSTHTWSDGDTVFPVANLSDLIRISENKELPFPIPSGSLHHMITFHNEASTGVTLTAASGATISGRPSIGPEGSVTVYVAEVNRYIVIGGV